MANWTDVMRARARQLRLRGEITFQTGVARSLDGTHILSATITEGADDALLPGAVLCAECTLELANDAGQWSPGGSMAGGQELIGATVEMWLGAYADGAWLERALGVFVISGATAIESEAKMRLTARDSVSSELSGAYTDGGSYPATLAQVWQRAVAQTRYVWSGSVPGGSTVVASAPAWGSISLRTALGMIAAAAGCFVRVSRAGALELCPVWGGTLHTIGASAYTYLSADSAHFGPVDAIVVGDDTYYATAAHTAIYPIEVSGNPLFELPAVAQSAAELIGGYETYRTELTWRGDPEVRVGDRICVTDTAGNAHTAPVARQTLTYASGFSMSTQCAVVQEDEDGVRRILTPEGGVNASMLVGTVDGGLISARSVTAEKLAASSVTAEKIATGAIDALAVTALAAKIETLTAQSITTDRLAAAMAAFEVIACGTATFDAATVTHLVSSVMNVESASASEIFITNLRVAYAQMVSAVINTLVIKASDGNYYQLDVVNDVLTKTLVTDLTPSEIAAAKTEEGRAIVETSITADDVSASTFKGVMGVINKIYSEFIDVDQLYARTAFIDHLKTTDISSDSSVTIRITDVAEKSRYMEMKGDGLHVGATDSDTETVITNDSFNVRNNGNTYSTLAGNYVQFGNYRMMRTSDGGLAFRFVGGEN